MLLSILSKALSTWSWISWLVAWINANDSAAKVRLPGEVRFDSF